MAGCGRRAHATLCCVVDGSSEEGLGGIAGYVRPDATDGHGEKRRAASLTAASSPPAIGGRNSRHLLAIRARHHEPTGPGGVPANSGREGGQRIDRRGGRWSACWMGRSAQGPKRQRHFSCPHPCSKPCRTGGQTAIYFGVAGPSIATPPLGKRSRFRPSARGSEVARRWLDRPPSLAQLRKAADPAPGARSIRWRGDASGLRLLYRRIDSIGSRRSAPRSYSRLPPNRGSSGLVATHLHNAGDVEPGFVRSTQHAPRREALPRRNALNSGNAHGRVPPSSPLYHGGDVLGGHAARKLSGCRAAYEYDPARVAPGFTHPRHSGHAVAADTYAGGCGSFVRLEAKE